MLKTVPELVSESFQLYKKNWRNYLPYMLAIFLPTLILSIIGTISLYLSILLPASSLASNIIIIMIFAASLVTTLLASIALIRALNANLTDQTLDWKENFKISNHLILPVIWVSFIAGLIILGGSILFVIPGIIFSVWYGFVTYPAILENARGMEALRISKSLVVGRWWQITFRLIGIGFVLFLISLLPDLLLTIVVEKIPMAKFLQETLTALLSSLINTTIIPFSTATSLILYYSAKANPVGSEIPLTPPKI